MSMWQTCLLPKHTYIDMFGMLTQRKFRSKLDAVPTSAPAPVCLYVVPEDATWTPEEGPLMPSAQAHRAINFTVTAAYLASRPREHQNGIAHPLVGAAATALLASLPDAIEPAIHPH